MKYRTFLLISVFCMVFVLCAQNTSKQPHGSSGSQAQTEHHQQMMGMQRQQMEAMKADIDKMKASLAAMRANLATIRDTNELDRWRNNVDLWQAMVDQMEQMQKHMESMGAGMMRDPDTGTAPSEKKPQ